MVCSDCKSKLNNMFRLTQEYYTSNKSFMSEQERVKLEGVLLGYEKVLEA